MRNDLYTVNGKELRLHLHPGQSRAMQSPCRFIFVVAGTQSGKTSFLPFWLDREIAWRGPGDYIAVTSTYDLFKLKFLPEMQSVFCNIFNWQYSASERVLYRGTGQNLTRIILRSADAEGGLESATAKAAVLDECGQDRFTLQAWEAIQRRLTLHQGRALGATTPYNLGWLKTQVYDRWRAGDRDYEVIQFESTMNPAFPREEFERARRTMPAWKFEMFYRGNFTRPAGLIYGDFTQEHVIAPIELPKAWPRFVGIDPGALNTAALWIAEDPATKALYLYREYLAGERTTSEHVKALLRLSEGERIVRWSLGQKSEHQYRYDWRAAGIPAQEPPIAEVEAGIDRVIAWIKARRLYVFKTCAGVLDQFGTYSRAIDSSGQVTEKIENKDTYHFMDALRYLAVGHSAGDAILFGA